MNFLNKKNIFINYKYFWSFNTYNLFNNKKKKVLKKILGLNKKINLFIIDLNIKNDINIPYLLIKKNYELNTEKNIIKKIEKDVYLEFENILVQIHTYKNNFIFLKIFLKLFMKRKTDIFFIFIQKIFYKLKKIRFRKKNPTINYINFENFKKLSLYEKDNELDQYYRFEHLKVITNDFKFKKIGDIIDYLKTNMNKDIFKKKLIQPMKIELDPNFPRFCDEIFWQNGNVYYLNNIKYSFKKNIINYESISKIIDTNNKYIFFSESYYESKDDLEKNDIIKLFEKEPVAINNNTIRSGRHRICAMIGRILKNQDYIPIKIVNEN